MPPPLVIAARPAVNLLPDPQAPNGPREPLSKATAKMTVPGSAVPDRCAEPIIGNTSHAPTCPQTITPRGADLDRI